MHICSIALGWPLMYLYGDGKIRIFAYLHSLIKTIKEHRENLKELHLQILPD